MSFVELLVFQEGPAVFRREHDMQVNLNQGLRDVGSLWCETPLGFGECKKCVTRIPGCAVATLGYVVQRLRRKAPRPRPMGFFESTALSAGFGFGFLVRCPG
jgi:hypothetical protein